MFEVFRKPLNVIRFGQGEYVDGIWQDGAEELFTITASIQPTPAETLMTLPEGYRTSDIYTLFTDTELRVSETEHNNPDKVIIGGRKYIVIKVSRWQNDIINHYEILVVKENVDQ